MAPRTTAPGTTAPGKTTPVPRIPLTRERVLRAGVTFADQHGIGTLSMRKLGEALTVEAMSLYNHVANKEELLDGMVDLVFSEIDIPPGGPTGRRRCANGRPRPARLSPATAGPSA